MGKGALDGLPGVKSVTTGFRHGYEVDVTRYDPKAVTMDRMKGALRDAGTFIKVLEGE